MKLIAVPVVAFCLIAAVCTRADSYSFKEPFRKTGAFNATGSLSLENVNGDVDIRAWDKNEILIEGEKSAKTEEELAAVDLRMEVSADHAAIKVRLPKRSGGWFSGNTIRASVRFRITVPATAVLDQIETVNARVSVDGVLGRTKVKTVNGTIEAAGLGGGARLTTVNGQINAAFASVATGQQLSFETVNGSVTIALPADAGVKLRTSVVNGRVSCDFPLTISSSSGRKSLCGTIGDGRASLDAETVNGGIRIERR